jgi:hypothetical protein
MPSTMPVSQVVSSRIVEILSHRIAAAKQTFADQAEKLSKSEDPAYELGWSMRMFEDAAEIRVYSQAKMIVDGNMDADFIKAKVTRSLVQFAKPQYSTSPLSNIMHQLEAAVWAKVYEELAEWIWDKQ